MFSGGGVWLLNDASLRSLIAKLDAGSLRRLPEEEVSSPQASDFKNPAESVKVSLMRVLSSTTGVYT